MTDADSLSSGPHKPRAEDLLGEEQRVHARVVARDELALLQSFDRSAHLVFCTALVVSGDASTAEDLTEGLFVEFWRAPEAFSPAYGPLALQMIRRLTDHSDSRASVSSLRAVPAGTGRSADGCC